jgi:acetyl-CoA carboxylase biotin carboxylase subunit
VDSGVYQGWEVPLHHDPLSAKLIACGADRQQAIARMKRAIQEYRIEGIRTNLELLSHLLSDPAVVAARLSTGFVEEFQQRQGRSRGAGPEEPHAIAAALAYTEISRAPVSAPVRKSARKMSSRPPLGRRRL